MIGIGFIIRVLEAIGVIVIGGLLFIGLFTVLLRMILFVLEQVGVETKNFTGWFSDRLIAYADRIRSRSKKNK